MAGHMYLRLVFIGSLCRLSLLQLAVVIDLILFENRSMLNIQIRVKAGVNMNRSEI